MSGLQDLLKRAQAEGSKPQTQLLTLVSPPQAASLHSCAGELETHSTEGVGRDL